MSLSDEPSASRFYQMTLRLASGFEPEELFVGLIQAFTKYLGI